MPKPAKLNTTQLAALRAAAAHPDGVVTRGDNCTRKALVARGYAAPIGFLFYITAAGRERAQRRADVVAQGTIPADPALLLDCCPECGGPAERGLCVDCRELQTAESEGMR